MKTCTRIIITTSITLMTMLNSWAYTLMFHNQKPTFHNMTPYDLVITYKTTQEETKTIPAHGQLTIDFGKTKPNNFAHIKVSLNDKILDSFTLEIIGAGEQEKHPLVMTFLPKVYNTFYIFSLKKVAQDNTLQDGSLVFYGTHADDISHKDTHLFKILETLSFPSY